MQVVNNNFAPTTGFQFQTARGASRENDLRFSQGGL
jgi:hypothetical protein